MDWWESCTVEAKLPSLEQGGSPVSYAFEVGCVPSQHQSNRGLTDRNEGLWAGFTVTSLQSWSSPAQDPGLPFSCFFAGDTGYAYSPDDSVGDIVCPAFRQIGDIYNGFDLALLPIG